MSESANAEEAAQQQNQSLSGRQRKRWKQRQHLKELKRQNAYDKNKTEQYEASDYYFEKGLRKVYPYHFTFTTCVQDNWTGRPILEVFAEQFQSNTRDNYRKAIEAGDLRVNGQAVSVDYSLKNNDIIISRIHRHENPVADEEVEVLHEDKDVLVVNKPASIPCQPCGRYRFNSVVFILCKQLGLPMLRNVYRLDWQTSGVMVCGKTKEKSMILEHQIQNGFVTKEYVARVQGEFPLGEVTLDQPIGCVSHRLFLWKVTPNGKPSKTKFERMSFNGTSSVVKCIPLEVRTAHHIRVHLQYLGHPIMNDPVYNSDVWGPTKGKAGIYTRPDSEVIKDVVAIHTVGQWTDERNPILDLKQCGSDGSQSRLDTAALSRSVDDYSDDSLGSSLSESVKLDNESSKSDSLMEPKSNFDRCQIVKVFEAPELVPSEALQIPAESNLDPGIQTVLDRSDKIFPESSQMVQNEIGESYQRSKSRASMGRNESSELLGTESGQIFSHGVKSVDNLGPLKNEKNGHFSEFEQNMSDLIQVSQNKDTDFVGTSQPHFAKICTCPCTCGARNVQEDVHSAELSNVLHHQSQARVGAATQLPKSVTTPNQDTVPQKSTNESTVNKESSTQRDLSSKLCAVLEHSSQASPQTLKDSSQGMKRSVPVMVVSTLSKDDGAKVTLHGALSSASQDTSTAEQETDISEPVAKRQKNNFDTDKISTEKIPQSIPVSDPRHKIINMEFTIETKKSRYEEVLLKTNRPVSNSPSTSKRSSCSRPVFNIEKWIPDPNCAECFKKYVDPDPKRLRIYLHALRYKGPGWEYSTKLPPWAEEDWEAG